MCKNALTDFELQIHQYLEVAQLNKDITNKQSNNKTFKANEKIIRSAKLEL